MSVKYTPDVPLVDWAYGVAESALAQQLPDRWAHVRGVADLAREIAHHYGPDSDLLIASALLHDIGWAPEAWNEKIANFAALDTARYLEGLGTPSRVLNLCANYSGSAIEARIRGIEDQLAPYADEQTPVRDALWYCDLRVGPKGERMSLQQRLDELRARYGDDPVINTWFDLVAPELQLAYDRTEAILALTCRA